MSKGFAKVRTRRGGGAKKTCVQVTALAASKDFIMVCETGEGKTPFKLYNKDDKKWERVPVGSSLLISGMEKKNDGFVPVFLDYGNRYPTVDKFAFLPAVSVVRVPSKEEGGDAYARVRFLDPENAIAIEDTSPAGIKSSIEKVLGQAFVPSAPSDRSFIIRWQDHEGKLQSFMGSEDLPLNVGVEDEANAAGIRVPRDVAKRVEEIAAAMQDIIAEEVEAGSTKFEFIPQCTMFGSRSLVDPRTDDMEKLKNLPFPTADSQWVVAKGISETTQREWKNYGIQPSFVSFKPMYDKVALVKALEDMVAKDFQSVPNAEAMIQQFIRSFYVGDENLNSSSAAAHLKQGGVDPSAFQTGWVVGTAVPEGYPSPIPVSAIHTELHKPEYDPTANANTGPANAAPEGAGASNNNEMSDAQRDEIEKAAASAAADAAMG